MNALAKLYSPIHGREIDAMSEVHVYTCTYCVLLCVIMLAIIIDIEGSQWGVGVGPMIFLTCHKIAIEYLCIYTCMWSPVEVHCAIIIIMFNNRAKIAVVALLPST